MVAANSFSIVVLAAAVLPAIVAQSQTFSADLKAKQLPFDNAVVTKCFGSSHAATALRADWQKQLTEVHKDLGTDYVRFHGLFDDDMSVVVKGKRRRGDGEEAQKCKFVQDQDFRDPGAGVYNATSQEECCQLCYTQPTGLPEPCVAAVFVGGKCYFKTGSIEPYNKTGSGVVSCVTNRKSPKQYVYSFVNIFQIFDFLRSIGMRPVVEVSFMPSILAEDTTHTVFWYKGILSPPKNFDDWRDFIAAFATAIVDRYGLEEVRQWYFEVWNEPNCCGGYPDTGCCGQGCGNQTMYLDLFTNTYKALKSVDAHLRVGGPATAQLDWIDVLVKRAVQAQCPPDFVSTHLYPTDPYAYSTPLSHGRDDFFKAISGAAALVASSAHAAGMAHTPPMLMTEFNCGLGMNCADAPYSASFIANHALDSQALQHSVPIQSYWTFSDIFEEQGQQPYEFSQAFGARSVNGIAKPVYRAMQLVRRLGDTALPVTQRACAGAGFNCTARVAVTAKASRRAPSAAETETLDVSAGDTAFEVLVVNHPTGPTKQPDLIARVNEAHTKGETSNDDGKNSALATISVSVAFTGAVMPATVTVRRVDATHANALPLYHAAGAPQYPNSTMITMLNKASELVPEQIAPKPNSGGGWTVTVEMPAYSVACLSFGA